MRRYLPTCNRGELDFVFGEDVVDSYLCESEGGRDLIQLSRAGTSLAENRHPLARKTLS